MPFFIDTASKLRSPRSVVRVRLIPLCGSGRGPFMTAPDRGERAPKSDDPQQKDEELERVLATVQTLAIELHPGLPQIDLDLDSRLDTVVGFDSLSFLELRDRLETEFGMSIPDRVFVDGLTPRDWLRAIATELAERTG